MDSLNSIWRSHYLCRRTTLRIFTNILAVLLCGSETFASSPDTTGPEVGSWGHGSGQLGGGGCIQLTTSLETNTRPAILQFQGRHFRPNGRTFTESLRPIPPTKLRPPENPGWRRPQGRPRQPWFGQMDQMCREGVEMSPWPPGGSTRGTVVD